MKRLFIITFLLITALLCNSMLFADEGLSMKELYQQGQKDIKEGRPLDALKKFEKGRTMAEKSGDMKAFMAFSALMGQVYQDTEDMEKACACYKKAADTASLLNEHSMALQLYSRLGELLEQCKQWKDAGEAYENSMKSAIELKDLSETYNQAVSGAFAYEKALVFDKALKLFSRAMESALELKDQKKITAVTGSIAHTYLQGGDLEKSLEHYEKAVKLAKDSGDLKSASFYTGSMGAAYMEKGLTPKALPLFREASETALSAGDADGAAIWLKSLAHCLFTSGKSDEALTVLIEIEKLAEKQNDSSLLIYALEMQGKTFSDTGDYIKAEEKLNRARELALKQGDKAGLIRILDRYGYICRQRGLYEEADRYYKEALSLASGPDFTRQRAEILTVMGHLRQETGKYKESLDYFNQGFKIASELKNSSLQNLITASMVQSYGSMGQFWKAVEILHGAQKKAQKEKDQYARAQRLGDLGDMFLKIDELEQARKYYVEALSISESIDDLSGKAASLSALGLICQREGRMEEAEDYFKKMKETGEKLKNTRIRLAALSNLSRISSERKDYPAASSYLEEALKLAKVSGDSWSVGTARRDMASLLIKEGKTDEAQKVLEELLKELNRDSDRSGYVLTLSYLGDVYGVRGDYVNAKSCFMLALFLHGPVGDPSVAVTLKIKLGLVSYFGLKDSAEALNYFTGAIDELEILLDELKLDELKGRAISRVSDLYELTVQLMMEQGLSEKALEYSERGRARDFLDSLKNARSLPVKAPDSPLSRREAELSAKIKTLQARMADVPENRRESLWQELEKAKEEYLETIKTLKLENPEYASFRAVTTAGLSDMRKVLKNDEIMLNYYVTGRKVFLFAITSDRFMVFELKTDGKSLSGMVGIVRKAVEDSRKNPKRASDLLERLYGILLEPASELTASKKTIIFVPHGPLHYLPFSALKSPGGKYLAETHSVITEPSGSAFVLLRKRPGNTQNSLGAFALGDAKGTGGKYPQYLRTGAFDNTTPLPGTGREVDNISGAFVKSGRASKSFKGREFTQERVEKTAPDCGFLHFATHGFISPDGRGSFSGLVTADGFIYVTDLYSWKLNARLAVLSACQTGIGRISRGDDMVGFSRAFMQAGADNLVATLWSVEDQSTSLLMTEFYRRVLKGEPFAEALAGAQVSLMKTHPEPFYWAPFVLFGR